MNDHPRKPAGGREELLRSLKAAIKEEASRLATTNNGDDDDDFLPRKSSTNGATDGLRRRKRKGSSHPAYSGGDGPRFTEDFRKLVAPPLRRAEDPREALEKADASTVPDATAAVLRRLETMKRIKMPHNVQSGEAPLPPPQQQPPQQPRPPPSPRSSGTTSPSLSERASWLMSRSHGVRLGYDHHSADATLATALWLWPLVATITLSTICAFIWCRRPKRRPAVHPAPQQHREGGTSRGGQTEQQQQQQQQRRARRDASAHPAVSFGVQQRLEEGNLATPVSLDGKGKRAGATTKKGNKEK